MNAKFRMASNGVVTCMELGGKTIGTGVEAVKFYQNGYGEGRLEISIDLENFSFMPDGHFEKFEQAIKETLETPDAPAAEGGVRR